VNKKEKKEKQLTSWRVTVTSLLMLAPPHGMEGGT